MWPSLCMRIASRGLSNSRSASLQSPPLMPQPQWKVHRTLPVRQLVAVVVLTTVVREGNPHQDVRVRFEPGGKRSPVNHKRLRCGRTWMPSEKCSWNFTLTTASASGTMWTQRSRI